jgi:4-amino-4-deoxy-L-arabinose transferase-like glycosyltransferase
LRIDSINTQKRKAIQTVLLSRFTVPAVISFSLLIKFTYAIFIIDPLSGSEFDTYVLAAADMRSNGFFGKAHAIPGFPVGYPWFIALIQTFFGTNLVYVSCIQVVLFGVASFYYFKFVCCFLSREIAVISLILLSFSPALIAGSTIIMYEIPMISFFIFGVYAFFRIDTQEALRGKAVLATFSGFFFGAAVLMQPKIIMAELMVIAIKVISDKSLRFRNITIIFLVLVPIGLAPALNIARNYIAGDGFGYTRNYSINVIYGAINSGGQIKTKCVNSSTLGYDNLAYSICLQKEKFIERPAQALRITFDAGFNLLTPLIGSLQRDGGGTWFHAFDFRRVLTFYHWTYPDSPWNKVDRVISIVWMFFWLSLVFHGTRILRKSGRKFQSMVLLYPTISLLLVSALAAGDSRYRLPVAPLYYIMIAVSVEVLVKKDFRKKSAPNSISLT